MKGIYVIAIASLASWAVNAANVDRNQLAQSVSTENRVGHDGIYLSCPFPQPNDHNTTTNIPHETDCTKFYKCFLGRGILQQCPLMTEGDPVTRLHYNRLLQVCDWPWQAGCSSCPDRYRNGSYPTPSKISHETDNCNRYYDCSSGIPSLRSCPYGTCFSRTCQECVRYREGGYCDGYLPPVTTPPGECVTGDTKAHDCDCAKYYVCYDNMDWIVTQCIGGQHYSKVRKQCLPPNEAGCVTL